MYNVITIVRKILNLCNDIWYPEILLEIDVRVVFIELLEIGSIDLKYPGYVFLFVGSHQFLMVDQPTSCIWDMFY